jgi:arsenate reductase (thioredoxin)
MLNLLFMCVANSARSQLAEGLAREIFGANATVQSVGSHPGKLNPFAVEAMKEIGIDISRQWSKSTDDLSPTFIVQLNYVITLCAEEVCPVMVSKAKKLHWPLKDPATGEGTDAEKLQRFRETRDQIKERLIAFQKELK